MSLAKSLLERPVLELAPQLLGSYLVREYENILLRVKIVETEAYREDDPASHSFNGVTDRSGVMFASGGHWYIYKCYGIHWMINVVCGPEGTGEAVLIRAAEPEEGLETMQTNRGRSGSELTNGPGKLAEALSVDDRFNGASVLSGSEQTDFFLEEGTHDRTIYESPRVGISVAEERPWRFFVDSEYLSNVEQNEQARRKN